MEISPFKVVQATAQKCWNLKTLIGKSVPVGVDVESAFVQNSSLPFSLYRKSRYFSVGFFAALFCSFLMVFWVVVYFAFVVHKNNLAPALDNSDMK